MAYISLLVIVLYIALIVLAVVILWNVIRSAMRRALRDHYFWVESRAIAPSAPSEPDGK